VARIDTDTGRRAEYRSGPNCCASEPAFAPDPSVSLSSPDVETSGWLICEVLDGNTRKRLHPVFDAGAIEVGPLRNCISAIICPSGFTDGGSPRESRVSL